MNVVNHFQSFWLSILKLWAEHHYSTNGEDEEFYSQILWYNSGILIDKKLLKPIKNLFVKGLIYVSDLLDATGKMASIEQLERKF